MESTETTTTMKSAATTTTYVRCHGAGGYSRAG